MRLCCQAINAAVPCRAVKFNFTHFMKKILFTLAVVCGTVWSSFAQSASTSTTTTTSSSPADHARFSFGLDGGVTLNHVRGNSTGMWGASVKYELPIAINTMFTISAGYTYLQYSSFEKEFLKADGNHSSGASFIPVKVGIKYYVSHGFFLEGQAGVAIAAKSPNYKTSFAWSPGVGYTFGNGIEVGARFENWSNSGALNQASMRLAYRF